MKQIVPIGEYMKKQLFLCVFALAGLLAAQPAGAQAWQMVGTRAMGMGGAGVATAYGLDAQYWNPAGLAQDEATVNDTGFAINAGASMQATENVLEGVRDLTDMADRYKNLADAIDNRNTVSAENLSTIFEGLDDISKLIGKDMGALVDADAGIGFKMKNFAVTARALGNMAIMPVVDTQNIGLAGAGQGLQLGSTGSAGGNQSAADKLAQAIDATGVFDSLNRLLGGGYASSQELANAFINAAAAAGGTYQQIADAVNTAVSSMGGAAEIINQAASSSGFYADNQTLAMADAATFAEVSLGYGAQVINGLKLGANLKVIDGYTAQSGVMILSDDQNIKDIFKKAYDNKKSSVNLGIDLGAQFNLSRALDRDVLLNPQLGLTVKNINAPSFDRPAAPADLDPAIIAHWNTDKYQLNPQVRMGAAINPFSFMTLAADLDLTENDTLLDEIKSRQLAVGMEINLLNRPSFNIPLRLGYNKNLASSAVSPYYTAGLGVNMMHFHIELAGAISDGTTDVDGTSVPDSAAASLMIGFLF